MNYSQKFIGFYIRISVLIMRLIGKGRKKSDFFKGEKIVNYFSRKYLPAINNLEQKEISVEQPETIWQFWDNPAGKTTPEIVKSCLESVDKFKGNFEHKILDKSSIENYTDLPDYVLDKFKKRQIDYIHFSDLLRLNLLKNHGGIWLDATGYMTDFIPKYIIDEDFFVFLTGELSSFPYAFMQNCFIRSKKGSFLCEGWYLMCVEFWKKQTKTIDYFQHQLMFKTLVEKNSTAKKIFSQMPHLPEYETHQLTNILLQKFDAGQWERIKKMSFFQKTTYKIAGGIDYSDTYFSKLSEGKI